MSVGTILSHKGGTVHKIAPDATIAEVVDAMREFVIGALVVTDGSGRLVGIISERDIIRGLSENGASFLAMPVSSCMASPVVTCDASATDHEVLALMTDRRFRHLPVVDKGSLVGIVSIGDVVKSRIDGVIAEANALRDYITRG